MNLVPTKLPAGMYNFIKISFAGKQINRTREEILINTENLRELDPFYGLYGGRPGDMSQR